MYKIQKLSPDMAARFLNYQRHVLFLLNSVRETATAPERFDSHIIFARLAIKCAKHGYMLYASGSV